MPLVPQRDLIAVPRSPQANSYATVAMADEYFDIHPLYGMWFGWTEIEKARALMFATKIIDGYRFNSLPVDMLQRLKMPRQLYSQFYSGTFSAVSEDQLTFTIPQLANNLGYGNDFWRYAGLQPITGNALRQHRLVVDYDFLTGLFTIDNTFDGTVLAGDTFYLTQRVQYPVIWAACEIAFAYLNDRDPLDFDGRVDNWRVGDALEHTGAPGTFILPPKAQQLLEPFIQHRQAYSY